MDGDGGLWIWYPPRSVVGLVLAGRWRVRGCWSSTAGVPVVVRLTAQLYMDRVSNEPRVADLLVKIASTSVLAEDGDVLRVVTLARASSLQILS
jgi:hypothetical protein